MSNQLHTARLALVAAISYALVCAAPAALRAQPVAPGVKFQVKGPAERLEMTVNTSRVVEFPFDVPRMLVNNPAMARVVPISPRSIQVSAVRAGVTQLNAWDANDNVATVDLSILGDDA
jgi:pilus assembly protein CpaC